MAVLALWYWSQGSISVQTVNTPKVETFYSAAITLSQTWAPHSAIGRLIPETSVMRGGTLAFAGGLAVTAALFYWTDVLVSFCSGRHSF